MTPKRVVTALLIISRTGCESFTSGSCRDAGSGKRRKARYGAYQWCSSCIAADALDRLAHEPKRKDETS